MADEADPVLPQQTLQPCSRGAEGPVAYPGPRNTEPAVQPY